jgi:hypothetical protein
MSRDPLEELFGSLDRTRQLSDAQVDEMFSLERLFAQVKVATPPPTARRMGRRLLHRGTVMATVAVLLVGSAAAAITLSRGPVQSVASMTCFQGNSLTSTADVVSYDSNPLATCSRLLHWPTPSKTEHEKGALCLLADGSLAVFPPSRKADRCENLGLVAFNGHLANPEVAKFQIAAENYFTRHPCESPAAARRAVLEILGTNGLVSWRVRLTGSTSSKACATLAFQLNSKDIDIVGIHR